MPTRVYNTPTSVRHSVSSGKYPTRPSNQQGSLINPNSVIKPSSLRKTSLSAVLSMVVGLVASVSFAESHAEQTKVQNWAERDQLPAEIANSLPSFCSGSYLDNQITPLEGNRLEAASQNFEWNEGRGRFWGDVVMQYDNVEIQSDEVVWDDSTRQGSYSGNVVVTNPDTTLSGESALYAQTGEDISEGQLTLRRSAYVLPQSHIRGTAGELITSPGEKVQLEDGTLTFCEPGNNQWQLAASTIYLDRKKGIGSAWNTRLEIYDVPVLYLPYYRFPIDDRRMTGFLNPSFSLDGEGQLSEFKIPLYLNIAPNLDATISPHMIAEHGWIWENQFRHKTSLLGDGEFNYEWLGKDETTGEERSFVNYQQSGTFLKHWSHNWVYNQVSDDDYFDDLNSSGSGNQAAHLPKRGQIRYLSSDTEFSLMAESYQTIDTSVALSDRPYRRLPQAELNLTPEWASSTSLQNSSRLTTNHRIQISQFERDDEAFINGSSQTLSGEDAINAKRLVADNHINYRLQNQWGYLNARAGFKLRRYQLYGASEDELGYDLGQQQSMPIASIDTGLVLERPVRWAGQQLTQTLEPRIMHIRSSYQPGQLNIPLFDTGYRTASYDSLFNEDRFVGDDRLADQNQTSVGLSSRFLGEDGSTLFSAKIGKAFYHSDRQVTLTDNESGYYQLDTAASDSSLTTEIDWQLPYNLKLRHTMEWDHANDFSRQQRAGLQFHPSGYSQHRLRLFNVSLNRLQYLEPDENHPSTYSHQLDTSLFWSINDSWAVTGRVLRDLKDYDETERRPQNPLLAALAGVEYQNCCWRFQLNYQEYSKTNDSDPVFSTNKHYRFMFTIQLKGLTSLGGSTDELLNSSIPGYTRRTYHDY